MKKIVFFGFFLASVAGALFLSGCTEPCDTVTCYHGGTCFEGVCDCSTGSGYEGEFCTIAVNEKFDGTWTMTETCTNGSNSTYSVSISEDISTPTGLKFNGLLGSTGFVADGWIDTVEGKDFSITKTQMISEEYDGNGSISSDGNSITITINVYDQGSSTVKYTCTGTMTK